MGITFLLSIVKQRIADLMKYHKISKIDFPLKIGCDDRLRNCFGFVIFHVSVVSDVTLSYPDSGS